MSIRWTKEQWHAICHEQERELLVSAAAGSGKTAVLTERILRRCLSGKLDLERLAVMTFTEKAAAHMKRKLEEKIGDLLKRSEDSAERARLRELQRQLPLARISTMHAFCLSLLREYQDRLTDENGRLMLQPGFGVLDETQGRLLREEACDEVLAEIYEALDAWRRECVKNGKRPAERPDGLASPSSEKSPFAILEPARSRTSWLESFDRMSFSFDRGKNDRKLRDSILSCLAFLRSLADYEDWCREALREIQLEGEHFSDSDTAAWWKARFRPLLKRALDGLDELEGEVYHEWLLRSKSKGEEAFREYLRNVKETLLPLSRALKVDADDFWNQAHQAGRQLLPPASLSRPSAPKNEKEEWKQHYLDCFEQEIAPAIQMLSGAWKKTQELSKRARLDAVTPVFLISAEKAGEDIRRVQPLLSCFLETVLLTDAAFRKKKLRQQRIDYADFEAYALALLKDEELCQALHQRYEEIYLDEYQDTNPLQEELLRRLGARRVFLVGDIKQSIYRFRHADPGLFADKLKRFRIVSPQPEGESSNQTTAQSEEVSCDGQPRKTQETRHQRSEEASRGGQTILLNRNFRSRPGLLDQINRFFRYFLSEESGEINYDDQQALLAGVEESAFPERARRRPSLSIGILLDAVGEADGEERSAGEGEDAKEASPEGFLLSGGAAPSLTDGQKAYLPVLEEVLRLLDEGYMLRDIAVLARTHQHCRDCLELLDFCRIPAIAGGGSQNLDRPEIRFLEKLLSLLDNFCQDLPLATVMRSDIHGPAFQEEELFRIASIHLGDSQIPQELREELEEEIRKDGGKIFFYRKLLAAPRIWDDHGPDGALKRRCERFLAEMEGWRRRMACLSLPTALESIVRESPFLDRLAALPYAKERLAAWENFLALAAAYGKRRGASLGGFIQMLRESRQRGLTLEGVHDAPEAQNQLRVMTLHASKGLEFPAVIFAGASAKYRRKEYDFLIMDAREGLGSDSFDSGGGRRYNNPRRAMLEEKIELKTKAEYFRLLYVCMTRAEERLHITGSYRRKDLAGLRQRIMDRHRREEQGRMAAADALNCAGPLELILSWAGHEEKEILDLLQREGSLSEERCGRASAGEEPRLEIYDESILPSLLQRSEEWRQRARSAEISMAEGAMAEEATVGKPTAEGSSSKSSGSEGLATEANPFDHSASARGEAENPTQKKPRTADDELQRLTHLLDPRLPGDEWMNVPGKLTVSELKRQLSADAGLSAATPESEAEPFPLLMAASPLFPEGMRDMALHLRRSSLLPERRDFAATPDAVLAGAAPAPASAAPSEGRPESAPEISAAVSPMPSAAAYGSLLHRLLQQIEISDYYHEQEKPCFLPAAAAKARYERKVEELIRRKALAESEKEAADQAWPMLEKWLKSDLARRLSQAERRGGTVWRELPFTLAVPAIGAAEPGGEISLVQGMIDLFFYEGDKAVLVDYKSDRLRGSEEEKRQELRKRYGVQLHYYAEAIRRIAGMELESAWIWLIRDGQALRMN